MADLQEQLAATQAALDKVNAAVEEVMTTRGPMTERKKKLHDLSAEASLLTADISSIQGEIDAARAVDLVAIDAQWQTEQGDLERQLADHIHEVESTLESYWGSAVAARCRHPGNAPRFTDEHANDSTRKTAREIELETAVAEVTQRRADLARELAELSK